MRDGNGTRRADLGGLAARQHGAVSLRQLETLGYSRSAVSRRSREGSLARVFPGVYRIGGARVTPELRATAALLWAGPDAVVSHDTAAALWGMAAPVRDLHVTVPRRLTSPPTAIRTHVAGLARRDCGKLRGVRVTSPARTLLDIAPRCDGDRLVLVVERAVVEGFVTARQLEDVVRRNPGRRGSRRLSDALGPAASSALERRIDAILRTARLPPFVREHEVGPYRLDFAWPDRRVGLEADGRRWHSSRLDFERDRAKHNFLVDLGWQVWRVTWRDLDGPARWLTSLEKRLYGQVGDSQHAAYSATPTGSW